MQFVSVYIWEGLKHVPEYKWKTPKEWLKAIPTWLQAYFPNKAKGLSFGPMSLNDVCCMVPAWFGSVATWFTFLFTYEVSESVSAGVIAAGIMAIIPAHMMRSSSGEFDNECVAMTAFVLVLWLWCRSIRTSGSWPWAILAALAYGFAAATWGGYIFINNLIGLHALVVVGTGQFDGGR
jgi:asparagine N-glycosylation enzyme membrane subunit Stt3